MALRHVGIVLLLGALAGCAGPTPITAAVAAPSTTVAAGPTTPAAAQEVTLTLRQDTRRGVPGAEPGAVCDYDLMWLAVSGGDRAVADAATAALDLSPDPADCQLTATVDGGISGRPFHEGGVLSLAYLVTISARDAAHPGNSMQTFVIDMSTGRPIALDDVLTPTGRAAFVAGCRAGLDERLADTDYCRDAYAGADAPYTVTRYGLVAQPFNAVPYVGQGLVTDGVLVPWSALGGGLRPGKVAALARS